MKIFAEFSEGAAVVRLVAESINEKRILAILEDAVTASVTVNRDNEMYWKENDVREVRLSIHAPKQEGSK